MRTYILLISAAILLTLTFTNCGNSEVTRKETELKQKEIDLKQREIKLQEQENNANQIKKYQQEVDEQSRVKYVYVAIKTNEPRIESEKLELPPDPVIKRKPDFSTGLVPQEVQAHFLPEPVYIKRAISQYYVYKSEIIKISNYSEDNRYMVVDKYQDEVNIKIAAANRNIQFENSYKPGGNITAEAKITSKESYVFYSYKEASIHRDSNN